jgi:hypothetical protein
MGKIPVFAALLIFGFAVLALTGCPGKTSPSNPAAPAPVTIINPSTYPPCVTGGNTCTPTQTPCGWPGQTCTFTPSATWTPTNTPVTIFVTPTFTFTPTATPTSTSTDTPCGLPGNTCTPTATTCTAYGLTDNVGNGFTTFGYYYADEVYVASPTTVKTLDAFGFDNNGNPETVYLALYDNSSGNLLGYGSFQITLGQSSPNGVLKTAALSPPASLSVGWYWVVACVPTTAFNYFLGASGRKVNIDTGTYAGGTPPASYSSFTSTVGGLLYAQGNTLYFTGCP